MKEYNDYMDSVSVDTRLHNKIVERTAEKSTPSSQIRPMFRYAAIVACSVVLLLGVWLIPDLWTHNVIGPELYIHKDEPPGGISQALPSALYPLTFNSAGEELSPGQVSGRILAPGFFHELTDEQFDAIFSALEPHFTAIASYWIEPTGVVWWTEPVDQIIDLMPAEPIINQIEVSAYDPEGKTLIRLAQGQIFDCYIGADREHQSSYVQ